jgi:plastocyanin
MKKLLFSILFCAIVTAGFCTTWTITNSGFTFSPSTITITVGDDVNFTLASVHDAVEVSQATWNLNGNTPLSGGFQTAFGGGTVLPAQLTVGTHYYVCEPHASMGMKGTIIVQASTGIEDDPSLADLSVYPNPSDNILTIKAADNLMGSKYLITNQTGSQLFNGRLAGELTMVDISRLKSGYYFVQVAGQKRQTIKLIKK